MNWPIIWNIIGTTPNLTTIDKQIQRSTTCEIIRPVTFHTFPFQIPLAKTIRWERIIWLVVWLPFFIFPEILGIIIQLTFIFFRRVQTTNQKIIHFTSIIDPSTSAPFDSGIFQHARWSDPDTQKKTSWIHREEWYLMIFAMVNRWMILPRVSWPESYHKYSHQSPHNCGWCIIPFTTFYNHL